VDQLHRALRSIQVQTLPAAAISIATDVDREGAAVTRQRALDAVQTAWTAFLDDDDEFAANHLHDLLWHANETEADYVYSWFIPVSGFDPFPAHHYTNPFNPANPIQTTITILVRTELAQSVGFALMDGDADQRGWGGEDYRFTLGCIAAGAKISHLVQRTWYWHNGGGNTSGLPSRW
jgi:hypothetical protein